MKRGTGKLMINARVINEVNAGESAGESPSQILGSCQLRVLCLSESFSQKWLLCVLVPRTSSEPPPTQLFGGTSAGASSHPEAATDL